MLTSTALRPKAAWVVVLARWFVAGVSTVAHSARAEVSRA